MEKIIILPESHVRIKLKEIGKDRWIAYLMAMNGEQVGPERIGNSMTDAIGRVVLENSEAELRMRNREEY